MKPRYALRIAVGALLIAKPRAVLSDLPHERIDRSAMLFARVLGARNVVEGLVLGERPSPGLIRAGAVVDSLHALTMAGLAVARPERRKLALANLATASALAFEGFHRARRAR
jgi:hypothetical protein